MPGLPVNAAPESRSTTSRAHRNAPLTPEERLRLCLRVRLNRLRDLDPPTGEQLREVIRYEHDRVGDLVHVDIKKLGRVPTGGGRRMHGVGTESARASKRTGPGSGKVGYTYLHSALDDHSRLAYTKALVEEKAVTAVAFWHRAVSFFAAHGITPIRRCLTDNGACYRSTTWADALAATGTKHKRTRPHTPRTNGKVERYNGTLTREAAYVRDYTAERERRAALAEFVNYYNQKRPHPALGGRPPISRTAGSDHRIVFDQPPEPLADIPQQLTFEDFV